MLWALLLAAIPASLAQPVADAATLAKFGSIISASASPSPNPTCIGEHCMGAFGKCLLDKDCRSAFYCIMKCKQDNQTCIFQCNSDFENEVYNNLIKCMFTDYNCMGASPTWDRWQACRAMDQAAPMTTFRGSAVTADVTRELFRRSKHRGDWILAKGLSHAYDCFDCQYLYFGDRGDNTMQYIAEYKIHKSNGGIRFNEAIYVAGSTYQEPARMSFNASDYGGLEHFEDWRVLAADESEDPQWMALYYCGAAPAVEEAYEGACLLTVDGKLPSEEVQAKVTAIYAKAGISMACVPDNSQCSGHPEPPFPPAEATVVV